MNRILKSLSIAAVLVAAGTAAPVAHAGSHNIGARAGFAQLNADSSCFTENNDGIVNSCSTTRRWDVPLIVDSVGGSGGYEVFVHALAPSPANIRCMADTQDSFGDHIAFSGWLNLPQSDVNTTISLPVSGGGTTVLYAACLVDPGAKIFSYNW